MAVSKVERRGKTRLVIDIRYKDERTGRRERYRRDAQVQTAAAARAENRRRLAELGAKGFLADPEPDEPPAEKPYTFADAVRDFRSSKAKLLKATTLRGYEVNLDAHLVPRFGDDPLESVDHAAAEALDADLAVAGLSKQSRANVQIALRSVLRSAVGAKRLATMPALPALPKAGRKAVRPPTPDEVDRVLAAAYPAARTALMLAADAGLRAGEIRGLRWGDVDLAAGVLYVRQTVYRGESDTPKSGHEREVPLSARLASELLLLKGGRTPDPGARVSTSTRGTEWGESSLWHAFQGVLRRCGLPGARVHDLRHYFVTRCFEVGGDAPTVRALAGHSSLATTQRYAHTESGRKRAVVAKLGGATVGQRAETAG